MASVSSFDPVLDSASFHHFSLFFYSFKENPLFSLYLQVDSASFHHFSLFFYSFKFPLPSFQSLLLLLQISMSSSAAIPSVSSFTPSNFHFHHFSLFFYSFKFPCPHLRPSHQSLLLLLQISMTPQIAARLASCEGEQATLSDYLSMQGLALASCEGEQEGSPVLPSIISVSLRRLL